MGKICGDNRFEIIAKAKEALIESTNIETSPKEMEILDSFLFRCWQMGWLNKYDTSKAVWVKPVERAKYICSTKGKSCEYANARGWCEVSACIDAH